MMNATLPGGIFELADGCTVTRMGYGAMQLAGPHVSGPPRDRDEALAVLRAVIDAGINHIDTADFYGPYVTNELIAEALYPYPADLHIVTKVGARRDENGGWPHARAPHELRAGVEDNLRRLKLDAMDVVNLRWGLADKPEQGSIREAFEMLAELRERGLIRHLGVSNVTAEQVAEARSIAPVVCVQNLYNVANRRDDALIDALAADGIAYVPYFPLGGFTPLQSERLQRVAERHGRTPLAIALAWLLQRSPNILLIPGTSSRAHLHENIDAGSIGLSAEDLAELDAITR